MQNRVPEVGAALLRDLARGHRILAAEGHNDVSLGHLSLRDPAGQGFWLKRGNIGLHEVTGERDFILLDFDGNRLAGDGARHAEWPIHAAIYQARADVGAVGHTHAFHATLLSATDEELRPYTHQGAWFDGVPRFTTTSALVATPELGAQLASALGDKQAVLMRNHGAAFTGTSVEDMVLSGIFLERAAQAQLALAASGLKANWSDAADARGKREGWRRPVTISNFWDYYNRQLDLHEQRGGTASPPLPRTTPGRKEPGR